MLQGWTYHGLSSKSWEGAGCCCIVNGWNKVLMNGCYNGWCLYDLTCCRWLVVGRCYWELVVPVRCGGNVVWCSDVRVGVGCWCYLIGRKCALWLNGWFIIRISMHSASLYISPTICILSQVECTCVHALGLYIELMEFTSLHHLQQPTESTLHSFIGVIYSPFFFKLRSFFLSCRLLFLLLHQKSIFLIQHLIGHSHSHPQHSYPVCYHET